MTTTKKDLPVTVVKEFVSGPRIGTSARSIYREIFRADSPEKAARSLPAQSIYLAVRSSGLDSSTELLSMITSEQYKILLDFDLWSGDRFPEKHLWHWLQVLDQEPGREALETFLKAIDPRILGIVVARYLEVEFSEEPTEGPLAPGYYTPDKGSTWLKINMNDTEQHRRFGKLLALIYETDPELFYQLLAESSYITTLELEESAYQDKSKRLWDEGIPEPSTCFKINTPHSAKCLANERAEDRHSLSTRAVLPLAFSMANLSPLNDFLSQLLETDREAVERELALIANAGIVHYEVDIAEPSEVNFFLEKVRGALNIGLERIESITEGLGREIYLKSGLQRIYQAGLFELSELGIAAKAAQGEHFDAVVRGIIEKALEPLPVAPSYLLPDGSVDTSNTIEVAGDRRAYTYLRQLEAAKMMLRERCAQ